MFRRKPTRAIDGKVSFNSSTRLPDSSVTNALKPVTLPPGWARLATTPTPSGSPIAAITIGIVAVAAFADLAAGVPRVTMRSTPRPIKSATSAGKRSSCPSAERYSICKFCPSM
jgi:hypothetical protein